MPSACACSPSRSSAPSPSYQNRCREPSVRPARLCRRRPSGSVPTAYPPDRASSSPVPSPRRSRRASARRRAGRSGSAPRREEMVPSSDVLITGIGVRCLWAPGASRLARGPDAHGHRAFRVERAADATSRSRRSPIRTTTTHHAILRRRGSRAVDTQLLARLIVQLVEQEADCGLYFQAENLRWSFGR